MIGAIILLGIAIFGLSVLFGKNKPDQLYQFLIWLIFAPILLAIGYNHALWFWFDLPLWLQILSILLIPFMISVILKLIFPKAKWIQSLQTTIFQTLIYSATFPFRFLWRSAQFLLQRERRPQRLNPIRPVVGARPPLQNENQAGNQRNNIFD